MLVKRKIHNLLHPKRGEVWMLHRVASQRSTNPDQRWLEVTPDWLEQRINHYRQMGYRFVPISEWEVGRMFVCITLDDGYADYLGVALPLFRRLQVPFAVYITTGFLDNRRPMWWYDGQPLGLSTGQLRQLAAESLCTVGAHTVSHPHLATLPPDAQRQEIALSKQQIEAITGQPILHFSYPHGSYNRDTLEICRELGFHTAVTTSGRAVRSDTRPLQLDRICIVQP